MNLSVDHERLEVRIDLDDEHQAVDLTRGGLGDLILDAAALGIATAWAGERSPEGEPWAALKPSTVRQKQGLSKGRIGWVTGSLLDPSRVFEGPREVEPRWATLGYHAEGPDRGKALGFHGGRPGLQEPRPIVGWSPAAQATAATLIRSAEATARFEERE